MPEENVKKKVDDLYSFSIAPVEVERKGELRVFCVFDKGGDKWRLTQGDAMFVKNIEFGVSFQDVLNTMADQYRKVTKKEIKTPQV